MKSTMPTHFGRYTPSFMGDGKGVGRINMSKEGMIQAASDIMRKLYYEDVEFFYGFLNQYANRKGIKV